MGCVAHGHGASLVGPVTLPLCLQHEAMQHALSGAASATSPLL